MSTRRSTNPGRDGIGTALSGRKVAAAPHDRALSDRGPHYRTFRAALADRANSPVDILAFGDSIVTGAQASSMDKRWLNRLRDALRAQYQPAGVPGGEGYVQMNSTYNSPWTNSTSPAPTDPVDGFSQSTSGGFGIGGRDYASTAYSELTFYGTGVNVHYRKASGAGTFTVSVDSAVSGTGYALVNASNGSTVNGSVQAVTGLTAGKHTLRITGTTGTVHIEGVVLFNGDESKGIRVYDGGRSGISTVFYNSTNTRWQGAVTAVQPDAVVFMLGTNDYRLAGTKPHEIVANVISLVTSIRAACTIPPSVLILLPFLPSNNSATAPYLAYYDAIMRAAGVLGDVDVLDFYHLFGSDIQANVHGLLNADLTHPSDKGYQFMADTIAGRLAPGGAQLPPSQPQVGIVPEFYESAVGTWTFAVATGRPGNKQIASTGAQNESVTYRRHLSAGTWKLQIVGTVANSLGIYTVYLDGTSVGTIDAYAASSSWGTLSLTGITVPTTGLHEITLKMATKNASSSAYGGQLSDIMLTRTA